MAYFPAFVKMDGKKCLVIGGGKVAYRKVQMFLDFGLQITVVAPLIVNGLKTLEQVEILERQFEMSMLKEYDLVIAATDQVDLNQEIAEECKKKNILVNVVNAPESGNFICPAYIKRGDVVAAISSGGSSPVIPQYLKNQIAPFMTEILGDQAEYLKSVREQVKTSVPNHAGRKNAYEQILRFCQEEQRLPTEEEFEHIINDIVLE